MNAMDESPSSYSDKGLTVDEARKLINEQIAQGLENIPAEIITIYGLEDEYPELIAKVDAEAALLSGVKND